jgi:hypothetical protein
MTTTSTDIAPAPRKLPETQRRLRGHAFSMPASVAAKVPALYATESTPRDEKTAYGKFFSGAWTWFIVEMDWAEGEAFGYEIGPGGEGLTYIPLADLEAIRPRTAAQSSGGLRLSWVVERDLGWTPKPLGEALTEYRHQHGL